MSDSKSIEALVSRAKREAQRIGTSAQDLKSAEAAKSIIESVSSLSDAVIALSQRLEKVEKRLGGSSITVPNIGD